VTDPAHKETRHEDQADQLMRGRPGEGVAFRWLTVVSPEEPDGIELQLALNNSPAAKAYQQAMLQQGQPAAMFYADDVKGDYERIKARGAEFTMPPTDVTASTIAMVNDSWAI
jgi:predicted enzyme related to lactoylglutathione lyase